MSGTIPPIPPPLVGDTSNPSNRVDDFTTDNINTTTTNNGPSDTRDTKIASLRLKFNAFKALEGEKVNGTFTRLKFLLNDLENNGVSIPQAKVNATFVNSLPRKWLSMNQTQRANNSIKNDTLAALYGKYNYEEGLIDQIQLWQRALLANQKRFYKRPGRVGSVKKPLDRSNETCFSCGKHRHFQKECPSNKISPLSYLSTYKPYNKSKFNTNSTPQQSHINTNKNQKDYIVKYKGLKAEITVLAKKIDGMTKGKSEKVKALMAITEDKLSVRRADARSGQWVEITMKK
ncbi:retrovirus-related pol polyprotein from transposon TNT 1-94, partial [Tanacetum coccineum]